MYTIRIYFFVNDLDFSIPSLRKIQIVQIVNYIRISNLLQSMITSEEVACFVSYYAWQVFFWCLDKYVSIILCFSSAFRKGGCHDIDLILIIISYEMR